jgi:hypothetical protein
MAVVAIQGTEEAAGHVEERDVMVAGHGEHRRAQPTKEVPRGRELALAGALREVAAHHDQVGGRRLEVLPQRGHDRRVLPAEVKVGDVGDGPHAATGGASTRSARGCTR